MFGKLLNFRKKEEDPNNFEMKVVLIETQPNKLVNLQALLTKLETEERAMKTPPLKDWTVIRNKIRTLKRRITEIKYEENK